MKINLKEKEKVLFAELDAGQVFKFQDDYYLVLNYEESDSFNAVSLSDSSLADFEFDDKVRPVPTTLVIYDR